MPDAKHGGMHSAMEKDHLQAIHDHAASLGADCGGMDGEAEGSKAAKAVKYMLDQGMSSEIAEDYARSEMNDISTAVMALQQLSYLANEMDEPDDAPEVIALMRGLIAFISGEIDELEQAAAQTDEAGEAMSLSMSRDGTEIQDFTPIESNTKANAPDGDFLVVDKDGQHLRVKKEGKPDHGLMGGAWAALHGGYRGNKYEGADKDKALAKLRSLYASEKMDTPSEGKSLDFSYAKSLGLSVATKDLAVKYIGRDEIKGYTFLWGSPQATDVEREYFTKSTDFWDSLLTGPRPLTWDHAQDPDFKAAPVIGQITEFGDDEVGRWYVAKMDRSHKYKMMIDKLIEQGVLGTSSDSAPQYVVRQKTGKATWLKQWPWFASALTDVPCEPRLIGSLEVLKSLGITIPDAPEAVWDWDKQRLELFKIRTL